MSHSLVWSQTIQINEHARAHIDRHLHLHLRSRSSCRLPAPRPSAALAPQPLAEQTPELGRTSSHLSSAPAVARHAVQSTARRRAGQLHECLLRRWIRRSSPALPPPRGVDRSRPIGGQPSSGVGRRRSRRQMVKRRGRPLTSLAGNTSSARRSVWRRRAPLAAAGTAAGVDRLPAARRRSIDDAAASAGDHLAGTDKRDASATQEVSGSQASAGAGAGASVVG